MALWLYILPVLTWVCTSLPHPSCHQVVWEDMALNLSSTRSHYHCQLTSGNHQPTLSLTPAPWSTTLALHPPALTPTHPSRMQHRGGGRMRRQTWTTMTFWSHPGGRNQGKDNVFFVDHFYECGGGSNITIICHQYWCWENFFHALLMLVIQLTSVPPPRVIMFHSQQNFSEHCRVYKYL